MKTDVPALVTVLAGLLLVPVHAAAAPPCEPHDGLRPYCGLRQPEDLEPLPDGRHLLVSQMNLSFAAQTMTFGPGRLSLIDTKSGKIRDLYPGKSAPARPASGWGATDCPGEIGANLSPHGIHLSRRADGRRQLLVVNHGGREAVEFFELADHRLIWRGCAVAPKGSAMNDVVARGDGGFIVSNMIDASTAENTGLAMAKAVRGEDTGFVWSWSPVSGYQKIPGSDGPLPNGVQVDTAERHLYYSVVGPEGGVRKLDLGSHRIIAVAPTANPDNLAWDGKRLLTAGVLDHRALAQCDGTSPCRSASHVTAIDPETMRTTRIFEQDGSQQHGVSVAVTMGRRLYIGAFTGDRVLSVPAK